MGKKQYKVAMIMGIIFTIMMSLFAYIYVGVCTQRTQATIESYYGCQKKSEQVSSKYGKDTRYYYRYAYKCRFTDENGKEHETTLVDEDDWIEKLFNVEYKCGDVVTIYYDKDYQEGDEVMSSEDVSGKCVFLVCWCFVLTLYSALMMKKSK